MKIEFNKFHHFQLILVWSSATLSIINFFTLPNKKLQSSIDKNTSFHRINPEMGSDVSDDSEAESELNSSLRSNVSSVSKRSIWNETRVLNSTIASKAPSVYSTNSNLRQRSFGMSTQSLASTRQPSDFNLSFGSEHNFYQNNQKDLTRDRFNSSQQSYVAQSPNVFSRKQCPSMMSLNSLNKTFTNARSSSRNSCYDIPQNFESGITQLNISGVGDKHFNIQKANRTFGSTDLFGESLRNRKSVLSPSRLSLNESHAPVNQSSWLAGGYWNSTSPQKKSQHQSNDFEQCIAPKDVFPMISRASSKSSGFESRENSLCDDTETVDRTFLFSEPSSLTQTAKTTNGLIKPLPQKPMTFKPVAENYPLTIPFTPTPVQTPNPFTNSSAELEKISPNFSTLSRTFSQFSLQHPTQQSPSHFQEHNNFINSNHLNSKQPNRINTDLPMHSFQRGNLIKLHNQTSMDQ